MQWSLNKLIACNLNENDIYCVLLSAYHFCDDILCLVLLASNQQWFGVIATSQVIVVQFATSPYQMTKEGILLS